MSLLRKQRQQAGFTIAELSKRTAIDPTALSKVEHGKRRLTAEEIGKLAMALGCRADDLVPGMEGKMEEEPTHAR